MRAALLVCVVAMPLATPRIALAQSATTTTTETSPKNVAEARKHYEKARALYQQGSYREAIAELEAARELDPNAKDLVFNLGVVHEKLADIDDALKYFRIYEKMDLSAQERERCEAYLRRLEGAKKELEAKQADQQRQQQQQQQQQSQQGTSGGAAGSGSGGANGGGTHPPPAPEPGNGRVDAATITAGAVTVMGLGFGIVMGVKAKSDQPASGFVTGPDGTYQDLSGKAESAHKEAVLADVGFGVALVGAITTAYLYFARPKLTSTPAPTTGSTSVSALPLRGGGAVVVGGSF
jgi:tetratricopeptide (TPR) repeat protein